MKTNESWPGIDWNPIAQPALGCMVSEIPSVRAAFLAVGLACVVGFAVTLAWADDAPGDKSGYSTGRTQTPETKGQKQPQGWTGPINTGVGGSPAESPQGQSPPGMQPAPEGSSKTTTAPDKTDK